MLIDIAFVGFVMLIAIEFIVIIAFVIIILTIITIVIFYPSKLSKPLLGLPLPAEGMTFWQFWRILHVMLHSYL
jgi:hypothetical protein